MEENCTDCKVETDQKPATVATVQVVADSQADMCATNPCDMCGSLFIFSILTLIGMVVMLWLQSKIIRMHKRK